MNKHNPTNKRRKRKPRGKASANVFVERAAALKAAGHPAVRLLSKPEVMAIANVSFPALWQWMRDGKFPRSRIVNGRSMWLSSEIDAWLAALRVRPLKGDTPEEAA